MSYGTKHSISYFLIAYGSTTSGVYKKIKDQISVWQSENTDFQLFVITDNDAYLDWKMIAKNVHVFVDPQGLRRVIYRIRLLRRASNLTTDVLYLRETFPIPYFRLKKSPRWIMEVQSIQSLELFHRSRIKGLLYVLVERIWLRNFMGLIFVSHEIRNSYQNKISKKKNTVISNGINLDNIETLPPSTKHENCSFFFIGNFTQEWQGLDQLIELARNMPNNTFHVVGENGGETTPENVLLYGELGYEEYVAIASKCCAAFGTLNQRITGMTEASPLKVREYLAMGLPVVGRYLDTDFDNKTDFFLELPNDGKLLSHYKREIEEFVQIWHGRRVSRSMVSRAIDASRKEKARLSFFAEASSR